MMGQTELRTEVATSPVKLLKKAMVLMVVVILFMGCSLFWPAGTFGYWEAWVFMGIIIIPMMSVFFYFIKKDPQVLERRMNIKEREEEQKLIQGLGMMILLAMFLIPGFDKRHGWSQVPIMIVIIADLMILTGYFLFALVLKENSHASRIVAVEEKQKVISTGLYSIVRHPMYVAILLIYFFIPLALGSYWAMIPTVFIFILLIARIRNEEKVLLEQLEGYEEYMKKTKYRLLPGIW